jgi:hypothetical protein
MVPKDEAGGGMVTLFDTTTGGIAGGRRGVDGADGARKQDARGDDGT